MSDYTELQKAAAYAAQDTIKFADEDEEMRALQQFHEEVDPETILALIAENERLGVDLKSVVRLNNENADLFKTKNDQLRSEIAGLKTGYEAYERVNAELMGEVEGLRNALRPLLAHWDDLRPGESINVDAARAALGQGDPTRAGHGSRRDCPYGSSIQRTHR
ncbi:hypothetical protein [Pseudomonas veronii]|uniref:hypothetical protein n=1 Tax=Pseudomonas veronii TaxID=76761 RepID=UPI000F81CDD3|nr:hypothetical protein [Pseudomonas veronii]RTY74381.1 hypothetical protein EKA83_18385 [Pseudomonas veronii]